MGLDRYLREKTYHIRRKQYLKQQKRGSKINFSVVSVGKLSSSTNMRNIEGLKKLIGIGLVLIALLLILSQCFFKGNGSEQTNNIPTSTEQLQTVHGSIDYYTAMYDYPLDPIVLPKLFKLAARYHISFGEALALWQVGSKHGLNAHQVTTLFKYPTKMTQYADESTYENLRVLYDQFVYDLEYFPLDKDLAYSLEDSWKSTRTYNGERKHYGTDLLGNDISPGIAPIKSITDGIVENIGWNELGGYRVGIRSNGGAYFYYAHFDTLSPDLKKDDGVVAGQILGYMGDTGYGPEITRGKMPVHLHIGIAVWDRNQKQCWINPFPILKYLEQLN